MEPLPKRKQLQSSACNRRPGTPPAALAVSVLRPNTFASATAQPLEDGYRAGTGYRIPIHHRHEKIRRGIFLRPRGATSNLNAHQVSNDAAPYQPLRAEKQQA
ncbi:MAG: hypothetical protein KatS3mg111_1024 [Pirellulaceae bacterium]|nr:MAG: hypothetical protein KatS3mg111_1024 [Pirellulaceae bacterium]